MKDHGRRGKWPARRVAPDRSVPGTARPAAEDERSTMSRDETAAFVEESIG